MKLSLFRAVPLPAASAGGTISARTSGAALGLNEVVDPPSLRSLSARAASKAGYITGAAKDGSTRESFILIPQARTAVQALN
jgi:hypothetical protein